MSAVIEELARRKYLSVMIEAGARSTGPRSKMALRTGSISITHRRFSAGCSRCPSPAASAADAAPTPFSLRDLCLHVITPNEFAVEGTVIKGLVSKPAGVK